MKRKKISKSKKIIYSLLIIVLIISGSLFLLSVIPEGEENLKKEEAPTIEEEATRRVSMAMVGDVFLHEAVYLDAQVSPGVYDFTGMITEVKEKVSGYDIRYYNQESVIGGKTLGLSGYPRFNAPDEVAEAMVDAGFNLVSMANNHTLDKNEAGVLYSVNFWRNKDVYTAGSYDSWESRNTITTFEKNGISFAFLSYTMSTNGLSAPAGKEYLVNVYNPVTVEQDIKKAKEQAEVIIVAMHWGSEYTHVPNATQKEVATHLSNLGVNLIIGNHPHVIQPIGYVGDTLVFYSLGNFLAAQKSLGIEKTVGILGYVDIVVDKDHKVSFENLDYDLTFIYNSAGYRNYKVYPFDKLTNDILNNHDTVEATFKEVVDAEVAY
jgi:poly-gamma-glutamate synthesis protein (capsule biosynthesis protein)